MMEQIIAIVKTLSVSCYFDLLKNEIGAITFLSIHNWVSISMFMKVSNLMKIDVPEQRDLFSALSVKDR